MLLPSYRVVVVGGRVEWSPEWIQRLNEYVRNGGTVVLNAAQVNAPGSLAIVEIREMIFRAKAQRQS